MDTFSGVRLFQNSFLSSGKVSARHYENMPIQIYRKFHLQKLKIFRLKTLIFFTFVLKTYIVGTRRGGSNEYPQIMFFVQK